MVSQFCRTESRLELSTGGDINGAQGFRYDVAVNPWRERESEGVDQIRESIGFLNDNIRILVQFVLSAIEILWKSARTTYGSCIKRLENNGSLALHVCQHIHMVSVIFISVAKSASEVE
jgi:hypothetical protein